MTRLFQFAAPLLAPLLLFPTARAQFRGGARSWRPVPIPPPTHAQAPAPVAPSRPSATPPVIAGPVNRVNGAAHVAHFEHIDHHNFQNVRCVAGGEGIGVPGLGFDFPHLAAISQPCNLPIFRHDGFDLGNSLSPTLFGGYPGYIDSGEYSDSPPAQQQPQVIVIQLPTPVAVSGSANPASQEPVDSPVAAPTPPPTSDAPDSTGPDLSPFILVKRDGRVVFASAFSINATQLRYITPEGIRRTVFLSDLDVEATQQMNEENGAVIRLRN